MANLTIDGTKVRLIEDYEAPGGSGGASIPSAVAAIAGGQMIAYDASGKAILADATTAANYKGLMIVRKGVTYINQTVHGFRDCLMNLGPGVLDGLAYGAPLFLSDTPGMIADAAGTDEVQIGVVDALWDGATPTKIARIRIPISGITPAA